MITTKRPRRKNPRRLLLGVAAGVLTTGLTVFGSGAAFGAASASPSGSATTTTTQHTHGDPAADHAGSGLQRQGSHKDAVLTAAAAPAGTPGMDVSGWQGTVDWNTAYANGARWAYVKATEGTYYTSSYFSSQYNGSYNAHMVRGAYHFAIPSNSWGNVQADYFVNHGGGWSPDTQTLPGALDIEYNPSGATCYGLSQGDMINWIAAFINEYHSRTGRWAVIYSTTDWWSTCTGNYSGFAGNDPLWIANYTGTAYPLPNGWSWYTMWQWSDTGTFPGDQNVFSGDLNRLATLANDSATGSYNSGVAGKCLDDWGAGQSNGNVVDIYSCNNTLAQKWNPSNGTIRAFGMCLDVNGGGTANGTKVQLYTCNGTGAQQWRAGANGSLVNPQSGRCLDDPGSTATDGTQLQIWDCNGTAAQQWSLSTS